MRFLAISLLRTFLLYICIIGAVRLMGKRQISELQTSELVVTLLISDIAAIPMQDTGQPLVSGLFPIGILVFCEIVISVLMIKMPRFRRVICGKPVVVINNGKLDQTALKNLRMSIEDLTEQLREKDVFALEDVAYALVETNGKLSVIKKAPQSTVTAGMLAIALPEQGIEAVVISDGSISDFSLKLIRKSRGWLEGVLRGKNLQKEDIFLMTADTSGKFYIIKKEKKGTS